MRATKLCAPLVLLLLLVFASETAWARGGRFAAPAGNRGPGGPPDDPQAPAEHAAPSCPTPPPRRDATDDPQAPPPTAPSTGLPGLPGVGPGQRRTAAGPGLADWLYWYETNRERFEDLRTIAGVTDANPLFHLGRAQGPVRGRGVDALAPAEAERLRGTILQVLDQRGHWPFTYGAAYIALGKIATTPDDVERLLAGLKRDEKSHAIVRESAVLGLGHLQRSEASARFSASILDRVRRALLDVLGDKGYQARTRAFAAVSLGLLGGQPTQDAAYADAALSRSLTMRLIAAETPESARVGLILGIELLVPASAPADVRALLRRCMAQGACGGRDASSTVRAHATLALGRIGAADEADAIVKLLASRRTPAFALRHSLTLAAVDLGGRHRTARPMLLLALQRAAEQWNEPSAKGLACMALGQLIAVEAKHASTAPFEQGRGAEGLLALARRGTADNRAFGALALGVAVRGVDETVPSEAWQAWRKEVLRYLHAGLAGHSASPHVRAAYALALGLARDAEGRKPLRRLLENEDTPDELRAYAALALGHLGVRDRRTREALGRAIEQDASELLRMRATTALGMLGTASEKDRRAVLDRLVKELSTGRSLVARGQVALTLGRMGDGRAVASLSALAIDSTAAHETRAFAVAALGLIGERETQAALHRLREGTNYLTGTDVVAELLDLL